MPSSVVLTAAGLNFSPNQLSVPDGSLTEATNVIIRRDNVIEPRRGFKLEGDLMGLISDRLSQIFVYRGRILRHYDDVIQFEDTPNFDGTRKFSNFSGSFSGTQAGLRMKSVEANGNFYFTTDQGIKKISATTGSELSADANYITNAGGIKALSLELELDTTIGDSTGFLPQDSAVAYTVVWAKKDVNGNLILGTPSPRTEIYNPLSDLLVRDYANLLGNLDLLKPTSMINFGDYVGSYTLPANYADSDLKDNLISLCNEIDTDIQYAGTGAPLTGATAAIASGKCTITFSSGNPTTYLSIGSRVFISGFTAGTTSLEGSYILSNVTATTIEFLTAVTGTVSVAGGYKVTSYEYRHIATTNGDYTALSDLVVDTPATNDQLRAIQDAMSRIMVRLNSEPVAVIPANTVIAYLSDMTVTTSSKVRVTVDIPTGITSEHFYQVYRSAISQATGVSALIDLVPSDEMKLAYEAYPSADELTALTLTFTDITPDAFLGANLYTNESTGEGALQANETPPFAKDVGSFKNSIFYANTKTRHKRLLSLLGVQDIIKEYNDIITANGHELDSPRFTIATKDLTNTYRFRAGINTVTDLSVIASVGDSLNGKYFTLNTAYNTYKYYIWFKTSGGTESDPAVAGRTGIKVEIATGASADDVAYAVRRELSRLTQHFIITMNASFVVRITNKSEGFNAYIDVTNTGFTQSTVQGGSGEDATAGWILLSQNVSPAIATDETARSIVRIINQTPDSPVYAYYIKVTGSAIPGQILLEAKELNDNPFYILGSSSITGKSFNPDISPALEINPDFSGVINTETPHGLVNGDTVVITGTSTTPNIDGVHTVTYISPTSFMIPVDVIAYSEYGVCSNAKFTLASENERAPNRVYFSKPQQPEAVPVVNYFELGAKDKEILRIFPLRDSLFVFKEDGLYRISGETTPFNQTLFDSSCILLAPDSVTVSNNQVYAWTTQGISTVSESGVSPSLSRPIDTQILKLSTTQYTNFKTATFGVGYESDNSYLVWTVSSPTDTVATICYRYSNLTNSWTVYDKSSTCAVVHPVEDKLYLGAGDVNAMEMERKDFSRFDYSERETTATVPFFGSFNKSIVLDSVNGITVGDVIGQTQTVTISAFNALLAKLDADTGVADTDYNTLDMSVSWSARNSLVELANKLDADTGVADSNYFDSITNSASAITEISESATTKITTGGLHQLVSGRYVTITGSDSVPSINGTFPVTVISPTEFTIPVAVKTPGTTGLATSDNFNIKDIGVCYNVIIAKLNADTGVTGTDYSLITEDTSVESVIEAINTVTKTVTTKDAISLLGGDVVVYASIPTTVTYAPQTMQDPLGLKHLREASIMFENKAFTSAKLSFSTDLMPQFKTVAFKGDGPTGNMAYSAPFRTYVPRDCQRCRFLVLKYEHNVARESWSIFGVTITGSVGQSTRAYK